MTKALLPTFHFSEKKFFFFNVLLLESNGVLFGTFGIKERLKGGGGFFYLFGILKGGLKVRLHKGEKGEFGGGLKHCFLLLLPHFFPDGYLGLGGRFGEGRRGLGRGKGEGV